MKVYEELFLKLYYHYLTERNLNRSVAFVKAQTDVLYYRDHRDKPPLPGKVKEIIEDAGE